VRRRSVGLAALLAALLLAQVARAQVPSVREAAAALAARNPTPVARSLQDRVRVPVVKVRGCVEAGRYAQGLPPSVEVIFRPDASEWGHAHVRVGEMVYDLGAAYFARATPMRSAGWLDRDAYGFVFSCTAEQQARLQQVYGDKVRKIQRGELKYQLKPWETPTPQGENCETFVVSTLCQHLPELGMYPPTRYAGATGLARFCLSSRKLEAVTIYSTQDPAASEGFAFRKVTGQ